MPKQMLYGYVEGVFVSQADEVERLMDTVATQCGFTVVKKSIHQFLPRGVTAVYTLAESHFISTHTYDEEGRVYFDVFICSEKFEPLRCAESIEAVFGATCGHWTIVAR